jgi:hypothetical protein
VGVLLAFAVGYAVGARGGKEGFEEVVASASAIRDSAEFHAFLDVMRSHLSSTLQELSSWLANAEKPSDAKERLARIRSLFDPSKATSRES